MAAHGRSALRNLFDESPTPHIAHPPQTHHRDFYLATDGSFKRDSGGGLGVVVETRDGETVVRRSVPDRAPSNTVAEYRALYLGLDELARRAPPTASVGVLVDYDELAGNVNASMIAGSDPGWQSHEPVRVPRDSRTYWDGITSTLDAFGTVRAAVVGSNDNPAHPLANSPDLYGHVNDAPDRCVLPGAGSNSAQVPPPSRADRNASD